MHNVLVTEGSAARPLEHLRSQANVIEAPVDAAPLDLIDAMVVRTYTRVDAALLEQMPRLKVVGRGGVGLDNIDVKACRSRGVEVVYTPAANTRAVAEYVFGLMLRLIRPYAPFESAIDSKEFKRRRDSMRGRELAELTLGVLGMGRIGSSVGAIAQRGFGMRVLFHDLITPSLPFPAEAVSMEQLLESSDILTIHVDGRPENRHLLRGEHFDAMKPDALLINAARGELIDTAALAETLKRGHLLGAAIDVHDPEPPPADYPLLHLRNALLLPHMAARTESAIENMSWVVRDVLAVLDGKPPEWPAP